MTRRSGRVSIRQSAASQLPLQLASAGRQNANAGQPVSDAKASARCGTHSTHEARLSLKASKWTHAPAHPTSGGLGSRITSSKECAEGRRQPATVPGASKMPSCKPRVLISGDVPRGSGTSSLAGSLAASGQVLRRDERRRMLAEAISDVQRNRHRRNPWRHLPLCLSALAQVQNQMKSGKRENCLRVCCCIVVWECVSFVLCCLEPDHVVARLLVCLTGRLSICM